MIRRRALSAALAAVVLAGCSGEPEPYGQAKVIEVEPGLLDIRSECSIMVPVTAVVREGDDTVDVDLSGEWSEPACEEWTLVELDAPLGGRRVIINGEVLEPSDECPGELRSPRIRTGTSSCVSPRAEYP